MKRALTVITLLALMAGFGYGVNRLIASRKHKIPTTATVFIPTGTRAKIVLPGTLYLAQNGELYRLSDGFFTNLHLSVAKGQWMQPAYVPGTQNIVAVLRSAEFSNLYLLDSQGSILRQLSRNATAWTSRVWLNNWMFWPHFAADGKTLYYSFDRPKDSSTYAVDFSVWSGLLNGGLENKQFTTGNLFTGGDVNPTPMANGDVMFARYSIGSGNAYSQIAVVKRALRDPVLLTTPAQDCGQPAPSPDGTMVAMVCIGGTGLQSTRLEVAPLVGNTLGAPRVLVNNCLCAAPAWAPDGSGLVYFNPADSSGHFELWWIKGALAATTTSPAVQVTTDLNFDATSPPSWSPLATVPTMSR
jgi:Tol biopolymer transport system component